MSKEQGEHRSRQDGKPVFSVWAMVAVVTAILFVVGCSDVPATNPFDPQSADQLQAQARIVGRVFVETPGDLGTETYALRVLDAEGALLTDADGVEQTWKTRSTDGALPRSLTATGGIVGSFEIEVPAGRYRVVFDAEKNGKKTQLESFETSPLELSPGQTVTVNLRVRRRATREMYECFNDADCDLGAVCQDAKCIVDVEADRDMDGHPDGTKDMPRDNCPSTANPSQDDTDGDGDLRCR